jgi:hypothetical protein
MGRSARPAEVLCGDRAARGDEHRRWIRFWSSRTFPGHSCLCGPCQTTSGRDPLTTLKMTPRLFSDYPALLATRATHFGCVLDNICYDPYNGDRTQVASAPRFHGPMVDNSLARLLLRIDAIEDSRPQQESERCNKSIASHFMKTRPTSSRRSCRAVIGVATYRPLPPAARASNRGRVDSRHDEMRENELERAWVV